MFNIFGRVFSILVLCAIGLYITGTNAVAAGNADVSILVNGDILEQEDKFTVSVSVAPNNDITGMQFSLSFDPLLVTADTVTEGNLLSQNGANTFFNQGIINNDAGTISSVYGAIVSPGQSVSSTGTFATITFTSGTTGGTSPLSLSNVVVGDIGGNTVPVTVTSSSMDISYPPVLYSIGNKTVNEGDTLIFTVSATDSYGDNLIYSASNLPIGASFDPATRTFFWTPNYHQADTYLDIHFEVSDGDLTDSEDISISVNNVYKLDVNGDGDVNALEMLIVGESWSESGPDGWIEQDINEDGMVNILDLILVGQYCT